MEKICFETQPHGMIKQLSLQTVQALKNGQSIGSIAEAVKELVENAFDANATYVEVKLANFGVSEIEVTDNGSGILSSDRNHVCLRHYTSKLIPTEIAEPPTHVFEDADDDNDNGEQGKTNDSILVSTQDEHHDSEDVTFKEAATQQPASSQADVMPPISQATKAYIKKGTDWAVETYGFRGEALNSLCGLSEQVEIISRHESEELGWKLVFDKNGYIIHESQVAHNRGTTIIVKNIFAQLRPRREAIKENGKREYNQVVEFIKEYAMLLPVCNVITKLQLLDCSHFFAQ